AELHECERFGARLEPGELLDIGAGDEAVLRRADHQALRALGADRIQRARQLLERLARERVGRLALLVEGEPDQPVRLALPAKMLRPSPCFRPLHGSPVTALRAASRRPG